jgi:hypothetical protein
MSQNSSVLSICETAGRRGVLVVADDALGGVGGLAGMKNEGSDATVACDQVL